MLNEPYDKILEEYLRNEFRVLNAHIPVQPRTLAELLKEEFPCIVAKDGNSYLFKRKELYYLAGFLDAEEQKELRLPILIEVIAGQDEVNVIVKGKVEEKVVSHVLGMPVVVRKGRLKLYKRQLAELRRVLRTATQYMFSPKMPDEPIKAG